MEHNATPQQIGTDIGKQLWNVFATSIGPYEDEIRAVDITFASMADFLATGLLYVLQSAPPHEHVPLIQAFMHDLEQRLVVILKAYHHAQAQQN